MDYYKGYQLITQKHNENLESFEKRIKNVESNIVKDNERRKALYPIIDIILQNKICSIWNYVRYTSKPHVLKRHGSLINPNYPKLNNCGYLGIYQLTDKLDNIWHLVQAKTVYKVFTEEIMTWLKENELKNTLEIEQMVLLRKEIKLCCRMLPEYFQKEIPIINKKTRRMLMKRVVTKWRSKTYNLNSKIFKELNEKNKHLFYFQN